MTQCYIQAAQVEHENDLCRCDNCAHECKVSETNIISDIEQRINPSCIVPAGECPECSALMYLKEPPDWSADAELLKAKDTIRKIQAALGTAEKDDDLVEVAKLAHKAEQSTIAYTQMVEQIARMTPYRSDASFKNLDGMQMASDAIDTMNSLIEKARGIVGASA